MANAMCEHGVIVAGTDARGCIQCNKKPSLLMEAFSMRAPSSEVGETTPAPTIEPFDQVGPQNDHGELAEGEEAPVYGREWYAPPPPIVVPDIVSDQEAAYHVNRMCAAMYNGEEPEDADFQAAYSWAYERLRSGGHPDNA